MRALWKEFDTNFDNRVSGKEWGSKVYAKQDIMSKYFGGSTLKEIREAFNRIDRNGDDSLTYDEFKGEIATYKATKKMPVQDKLAMMMSSPKGEAKIRALWKELDTNFDNRVSGKEWGSKVYAKQDIMSEY